MRSFSTVILNEVSIITEPSIDVTPNGISEVLTGTSTVAKFLRIDTSTMPEIYQLNSLITNNPYLGFLSYLGTISVRVFSATGSLLGTTFSSISLFTSQPLYISIVAIPPDEEDPAVKGAKADANLGEGMQIEYTIIAEVLKMDALPLNTDFRTNNTQLYDDNFKRYWVNFETDTLLAFNSTSPSTQYVNFYSQEPGKPLLQMNSFTHDVLNRNAHFMFVPAGEYVVQFPLYQRFEITTFAIEDIAQDGSLDVDLQEGEMRLFRLPSDMFLANKLNMTFVNDNNQSSLINSRMFYHDGLFYWSTQSNYSHYYDVNATLMQSNFSTFNTGNTVEEFYLLVHHQQSWRYLANGTYSTNFTDPAVASLEITRQNLISFLSDGADGMNYLQAELADTFSTSFNSSVISPQGYLTFDAMANTGYRITVDATNVSINGAWLYADGNSLWYAETQFTPQMINNETHYIVELVFATTDDRKMGLLYNLATAATNGSVQITLETIEIHELPEFTLEVIKVGILGDDGSRPLLQNPVTYVAIIAVIGGGLLIRRRFMA
ncbi:MAG: hypothetical protein ACXAE3_15865 [Candidatus Kariarchaeaceae archaeon]